MKNRRGNTVKKFVAGITAACLIAGTLPTSVMTAFAEEGWDDPCAYNLSQDSLIGAIEEAVDGGSLLYEKLDFSGDYAYEYEDLFYQDGTLYELSLNAMNLAGSADRDSVLDLRAFVRISEDAGEAEDIEDDAEAVDAEEAVEDAGYTVNGSEKVIFLLQNRSDEEVTAKIYMDGRESHRIVVLPHDEIIPPETSEDADAADTDADDGESYEVLVIDDNLSEPAAIDSYEVEIDGEDSGDDAAETEEPAPEEVYTEAAEPEGESAPSEETYEPEEEQTETPVTDEAAEEEIIVEEETAEDADTEEETEEEEEKRVLPEESPIDPGKLLDGTIYDPVCVGDNGAAAFGMTLDVKNENTNEIVTLDAEEEEDEEEEDIETLAAVEAGDDDSQVINGYGTIKVTDQQSSAVYNINVSDAPTNTNISLSSKNISITDESGNDMSGSISLTGKLYYVPTGSEDNTESWSLVSYLMLDGNQQDGTGKDKDGNDTTYYKVLPYGDSGTFDMTAGSLYLKNTTIISARADIIPVQTNTLCYLDENGNYQQEFAGLEEMTSMPQTYYYPGQQGDVVNLSELTNGKGDAFYYGSLESGSTLEKFDYATIVQEVNNVDGTAVFEYYLYPSDENGTLLEGYNRESDKLYMDYDHVYSFDVTVNSIPSEHTEDNGDVYLWAGDTYYVDQYHAQGIDLPGYTRSQNTLTNCGIWVQLGRIREEAINGGTATWDDYRNTSYADMLKVVDINGYDAANAKDTAEANAPYGIVGPYVSDDAGVQESIVRVTGHIGDEFVSSDAFGSSTVYMILNDEAHASAYHSDWINLGSHASDKGFRAWFYWINDYYLLNDYTDKVEFVEIVENENGEVRLEVDEMGGSGLGEEYDVWNISLYTARDSVVKTEMLRNQSELETEGVGFYENVGDIDHIQLRLNGTVETVIDGEVYYGTLSVLQDLDANGQVNTGTGSKAPYVEYSIVTNDGTTEKGSAYLGLEGSGSEEDAKQETSQLKFNGEIDYDDKFDTDKVQIYVRIYFTGELDSSDSDKTIIYTKDDPFVYEGYLTEEQLRAGYSACPLNTGYDVAIELREAFKTTVELDTELILYKIWDDNNNEYNTREGITGINVTLDRSEDGESWETVPDDQDSEKAKVFTITPPIDEDGNEDTTASQWSLVLTPDALDLTYNGDGGQTELYLFKVASETFVTNGETGSGFTYDTIISGTTVTNTLLQGTTTISGKKEWVDANGNTLTDTDIPVDNVIITLYQNGHYYERTTVSSDNDWAFEFTDLPVSNGAEAYVYTLGEMTSDGRAVSDGDYVLLGNEWFKVGIKENNDGTCIITNTSFPTGSLNISKHVVEGSDASHLDTAYTVVVTATADSVDYECVTVTADGEDITSSADIDSEKKTITFTIKNGQTVTIDGLPEGSYTVAEIVPENADFVPIYRVGGYQKEGTPTVGASPDIEEAVTVEIDNGYPVGTYIQVKKNYDNDVYPAGADAFTFTITALSCDPAAEEVTIEPKDMPMPTNSSVTITDGTAAVSFGQMEFEHLGTYYYKITETPGSLTYVDYDSSVYYVKVVVSFDENSGGDYYLESVVESYAKADAETEDYKDLEYTSTTSDEPIVTAEFTNTYSAEGGLTLTATKDYTGAELKAGQFNFTITETTEGATYTGTGTNDDNGNITFTPAIAYEYKDVGTHTYEITETAGSAGGVTYDPKTITVTVDVTDNSDGTLSTAVTVGNSEITAAGDGSYNVGTFINTYEATGKVTLTATKEYTGADLTEGQFNFTIYENTEGATYTGAGTNDASGNITFTPAIEYTLDDVGTHTYVVGETTGSAGGVTYDGTTISVSVEVKDNGDGTLSSSVTVGGEQITAGDDGSCNVGTFSNSYQATGSVTFGGEKTISGKDEELSQQFEFALYTTDSTFVVGEDAEATDTQTVTGAGSFTFKSISYDSDTEGNGAGTYYYVVKETSTNENGWTMDTNEYHITVVVTDAGDGTFKLAVTCVDADGETGTLTQAEDGSYSFTGLDFGNTYKAAETSVQFTGTKYITNRASNANTDKEFTFELYNTDSSFTASGDAIQTKTTTGAGDITFDKITYDKTGTYYYVIKEASDASSGWTMSDTIYNITVEVTDNGLGQLVATVTANGNEVAVTDGKGDVYGGFDFTNAYDAAGAVTLSVVKSISGVASTEEEFEFTLYGSDESFAAGDSIETITTDGTITNSTQLNFTAIPYTKEGTYYYVIKETGTAPAGWTLDGTEYHVTVTVSDNKDGTLTTSASYTYTDETGETQTENSAAFTNTYKAAGSLSLTGTKTLEGGTLEENGFKFTMTNSVGDSVGEVTMDADGTITFPTLTFDETDIDEEYTYTITEVNSNDPSVQYDETTYTVVVKVADNVDGTLNVTYTVNGTENGDITFTNYQNGSLIISKTFTGLTDEQIANLTGFTITVTSSDGETVATLTLDDADENSSYTWTVSNLPADTYTVTESGYSLDGYEVIAKSGEVTVTDGTEVSVDDTLAWGGKDTAAFTNDYTEVGSLMISKHVIEGTQASHLDVGYTVVITADGEDDVDFQWVTVTDSSTGEAVSFTTDTDAKTITFTIKNGQILTVSGLPAGAYKVEETVSDDGDSFEPIYRVGSLEKEIAPTVTVVSGEENVDTVEIDNEYPIGTYIQVKKNYNNSVYPQDPDAFSFTIEALSFEPEAEGVNLTAAEMPMPTNKTVSVIDDNAVTFGPMTFEHLGTYYYKITETKGDLKYVSYDSSIYYVKIVVSFDETAKEDYYVETAEESYCKCDEEADDYQSLTYTPVDTIITAEFDNTYSAKGAVTLTATKDYAGAALTEDLFDFTLTETTEGVDSDKLYSGTGTNDADGNIVFDPEIDYTFEDVGEHTYVISEKDEQKGGVTYDTDTISVTVVVTDKADGTLETTVTVGDDILTAGEDGAYNAGTFYNSYKATGSVTFGGEKKISGKDEELNQQFEFSLYATDYSFEVSDDDEATDVQTVTGADTFTFVTIAYDSDTEFGAGTYYYLVKETSVSENGWTKDETEYHITVVVTDAGDGTFTMEVTCVDAEGETVTLKQAEDGTYSFTGLDLLNSYEAAPTSVQFTGTKYLTNSASDRESTNKVFTFELYDTDESYTTSGDPIDTQTTTGAGSIVFRTITYDTAGTYYYVMEERGLDEAEGWTIDPTVYNIIVDVKDDGLGQLIATVTANGNAVAVTDGTDDVYGGFDFTNAYAAEGEVTLGVVKSIAGVSGTDEKFEFTLYNSDENFATGDSVETITTYDTIVNSTQLNFSPIEYTEDGTYCYVIKETGKNRAGWTLDDKEYHVTVTVTDNGDGTLTTSASYAYTDEEGETQTENSAAFTNTYAATGELSLTGTKMLIGGTLKEDGFSFTMTDGTGASVGDVTMDKNGTITFPTLTYDETDIGGEYTYTITEVNANDASVQYDDTTYTVVVSVADNKDGTLDVSYTVNGEESGDIEFTNYQKGSLTITKTFTGLTDDQIEGLTDFTITVTNSDGETVATLTIADAATDEDGSCSWTVNNLVADTYTVTESGYSLDGYEVIAKSAEMEVTDGSDVSADDKLDWGGEGTVEFDNDYIEVGTITISKYVVAESDVQEAHEDTEYTVVLTADDRNVDFQWVSVACSSGREITPTIDKKTITFTIMEYETVKISGLPAGDYTIEETASDAATSEHFTPIYRVGDEENESAPTVTVASGSDSVVAVEIDNEYPITTNIMVRKEYNKDEYPEEGFTFKIEALSCDPEADDVTISAKDMPMPDNDTVTITESGETGYFGNIEYEHLGTYYYKIIEEAGKDDHIVYDSSVHYIKVVVAFDAETHVETTDEYEATADAETDDYRNLEYTEAGIVTAEFANTLFEELSIEKEVAGNSGDTTEYEFEITLTNPDGTPFEGTVTRTNESADGASANRFVTFFTNRTKAFAAEEEDSDEEDDGTVTFVDGKATVTVAAGDKVTLLVPHGVNCTITEMTTGADTTIVYDGDEVIATAKGNGNEAKADVGTISENKQIRFVNSYRSYFPIDEEIVPDYTDRDTWVKEESVNEYNAIEIEMSTFLPQITGYDLENGEFTMNFHEKLDSQLVLDEADADFLVFIDGKQIDHQYYTITLASEASPARIKTFAGGTIDDGCTFHVDVNLTALYEDGVITEEHLQGDTEIIIFFFVDLEGTGLNGSYTSTVWYEIFDGEDLQYTSNVDVVEVYTYEIDLVKYDASTLNGTDYDGSALAGATFGIYYDARGTDPVTRNGEPYTVTSGDDGKATFYGLADGTYYVKELAAPAGFVLSDEVLEIVLDESLNESGHVYQDVFADTPITTEISGSKIWDDADNQDGRRPESITVRLWADGEQIDSRTVTEADGWEWSFTDLNQYKDGKLIAYTVTEDRVEDYTTDYDANNGTITNSYSPEKTSLTVFKVWDDKNDQDGLRPDDITVTLVKNDVPTDQTLTLSQENGWIGTFSDLDVYEDGEPIEYTVQEAEIYGYESAINDDDADTGFIITNTHTPEVINISVSKTWDDADNQDGLRPDEITVRLVKNGVATDQTLTLSEKNGWTDTFSELYEYENGEKIAYTVKETDVPEGYVSSVTGDEEKGYTITNTHETEILTGPGPEGPPTDGNPTPGTKTGDISSAELGLLIMLAALGMFGIVVASVSIRRSKIRK